jgi:adenosine deaminase
MSLESYIQAMPKVDIHIHFEGSLKREFVERVADQNDISSTMRGREYREWMELLRKPDVKKLDDMARTYASWLKYPEDLSRAVYELGLHLKRQNIRYAEVHISPAIYTDGGMTFEGFLDAINDGRDRVLRGWQVRMDWIFTIPRDRPRKGDDISRWVTSAMARKGNVIGMGIVGREDLTPAEQFAKAFAAVEKRDIPTMTTARSSTINPESIRTILNELNPRRVVDVWGVAAEPDMLAELAERQLPVVVTPTRELRLNRISHISEYPLRLLMSHVCLSIASGMPSFYRTTLTDELLELARHHALTVDEVETLVLNGVYASFMPAENKEAMAGEFRTHFNELRAQHLT